MQSDWGAVSIAHDRNAAGKICGHNQCGQSGDPGFFRKADGAGFAGGDSADNCKTRRSAKLFVGVLADSGGEGARESDKSVALVAQGLKPSVYVAFGTAEAVP